MKVLFSKFMQVWHLCLRADGEHVLRFGGKDINWPQFVGELRYVL